jgi:biopolymer transport protein ExbB/TolQ
VGRGAEAGEGGEVEVDELKKRRFVWGVVLAWAPWIPTLVGIGYALRGISEQRATGIGAVAGGLSEVFVLWGIGATLVGQVAAIVLLAKAFSPGHWVRSLFSILSICLSGLALLPVFFFVWLTWFQVHRASGLVLP